MLTVLGISGGGIFGTLQYVGLQYTGVVNMGVLNSVAPALIVLASFVMFRDPIRPHQVLGIAVSLAGVLAMVSKLDPTTFATLAFNRGDVIIFANMLLFAVYSAALRWRPQVSLPTFLFALSLPAAAINLPSPSSSMPRASVRASAMSLGAVAYATVFTSIVAYVCWSRGVELLGPGVPACFCI